MNDTPCACENPFDPESIETLHYVEIDYSLAQVADTLKQHGYRGAICGPAGHGKSALLKALGDQLMEHGLTPLPLFAGESDAGGIPKGWMRTIRRARPTDVLLLDGFGLLPRWARAWILLTSWRAGGVVVTSPRSGFLTTVARPTTSPALLRRLIDQLAPTVNGSIDTERLHREAGGDLRQAFSLAHREYAEAHRRSAGHA